ncbi:hypothetical protein ACVOMT_24530 (plasmid) [Sphingomonas panni]
MANSYTKAAFHLLVSAEEAAMLRLAERAVDILDTNGADEDLALGYDSLGTAFRALFPPKGASMFESFLELFDDWSFPTSIAGSTSTSRTRTARSWRSSTATSSVSSRSRN